ncbi:N-acetylneuraminate synthase [Herbaspirillum sp. Sphag1AN]|uniref:N-acetylneuraminate synthase n=1 Tax=unclassified Herbaspirillum TaxID=2624150 RepID=UPI001621BEAF|nr:MULTISPECIES: N-acetylneuraminate synthase [unclassified Herbaspirillum]MBB3213010.1 N-acetylneuraminate synthase [Herbaspirillum sp. Sphag1AN]MBB3246207.1 N-acetylneuraminate synthase [Herbaspirillum sp. Sphag64]
MRNSVYIIAEAGVNHNGSLELAKKLVEAAAFAGADAVKFQTFKANKLVSRSAPKAQYQLSTTDVQESQHEMIRKLELSEADHRALIAHCATHNIEFLSTPFDHESLQLLVGNFDMPRVKLSSGDITNAPLLLAVAQTGKPAIVSTGMSTMDEIKTALSVLAFGYIQGNVPDRLPSLAAFESAYITSEGQSLLRKNVTLLHCTTEYPAPFEDVNLHAMNTIASQFGLSVGYSDHTVGIAVPVAAVALGATLIEKHFTLDRSLPGPDHKASLEPDELKAMVQSIREVELALGSSIKQPASSELKNRAIARKSLVAAVDIAQGELFTIDNLTVKRPGDGIAPIRYWDYIGKPADRNYLADDKVLS